MEPIDLIAESWALLRDINTWHIAYFGDEPDEAEWFQDAMRLEDQLFSWREQNKLGRTK